MTRAAIQRLTPKVERQSSAAGDCRSTSAGRLALGADDFDLESSANLRVQPDSNLVRPDGLDRIVDLDLAPVEFGTAGVPDRRGDVGSRDRPEQPAAAARAGLHRDPEPGQAPSGGRGVINAADLAGRASALDQLDLLLGAAAPAHRQAARHQVVPSVPARDLDHVAGGTQARDLLGEDELLRRTAHRLLASLARTEPCSSPAP